jgi:hypothetical protein
MYFVFVFPLNWDACNTKHMLTLPFPLLLKHHGRQRAQDNEKMSTSKQTTNIGNHVSAKRIRNFCQREICWLPYSSCLVLCRTSLFLQNGNGIDKIAPVQIHKDGRETPDMLEDGGGSRARAWELPTRPHGDGYVDVELHDGPSLHRGAVPFPFPRPPGHNLEKRTLHLHAVVRHERPEQAHDAGGRDLGHRGWARTSSGSGARAMAPHAESVHEDNRGIDAAAATSPPGMDIVAATHVPHLVPLLA